VPIRIFLIVYRYDYSELLRNSTFCLVPRGRRVGSFRFLESMQYGCIPVLLSNGWDLPFQEVIDWSKFTLNIDERTLLQLPSLIRSIPDQIILSMRQQALFIFRTYFSSVSTLLSTMFEVSSILLFFSILQLFYNYFYN
jgi:Exostosin family.